MTYQECYRFGLEALSRAGIEEAGLDARLLLEHVCRTGRNDLLVHGNKEVELAKQEVYRLFIEKRAKHIPLQYITGVQEFMGLKFCVNEHTLIPRQDTETLVEEVLREVGSGIRILDMCTGSGCILISLLHYLNDCKGVGIDISEEALVLAKENAKQLREGIEVSFICSDLFTQAEGKYDVIVSNPPYIKSQVLESLMPEVREHEPRLALDGREDGLFYYNRIIPKSRDYLLRGGRLFLEIGYDQGEEVSGLMKKAGFREVEVRRDLAGNNRVVTGTYGLVCALKRTDGRKNV